MRLEELLEGVTPEHNIPDDFVEAVRTSYGESVDTLTTEINGAHAAAIDALNVAHAAEIDRIKAEKLDALQDADNVEIDSVGDSTIDESTYWEEAE